MEQVGLVVDIKENKAIIAVRRHDVCGKCGGCGVAVSGSGENHLEAINQVNAVIGQTVRVASDTADVLKASFMVYMVPMIALLVGIYVGQLLDGTFSIFARFDVILGIVFLLGSYFLVRGYDRKVSRRQVAATVIEILPEPFNGPTDEKC